MQTQQRHEELMKKKGRGGGECQTSQKPGCPGLRTDAKFIFNVYLGEIKILMSFKFFTAFTNGEVSSYLREKNEILPSTHLFSTTLSLSQEKMAKATNKITMSVVVLAQGSFCEWSVRNIESLPPVNPFYLF